MIGLFRQIGRFINNMDSRAYISLIVMALLMGFVAVMMMYGADWLGIDEDTVNRLMIHVSESPFALVGVIAVFSALALTGFPQTLLIAGTVAVFGAEAGALNSWIATMCSATLTFMLGHASGGAFVRRLSAGRAASMIEVVRAHGILTSMIVRVTPSAPFIVINAICGAAHIPIWKFWLGTGLGIFPKILIIALFTRQVDSLMKFFQTRDPADLVVLGAVLVGWLAFLFLVRLVYMRLRKNSLHGLDTE